MISASAIAAAAEASAACAASRAAYAETLKLQEAAEFSLISALRTSATSEALASAVGELGAADRADGQVSAPAESRCRHYIHAAADGHDDFRHDWSCSAQRSRPIRARARFSDGPGAITRHNELHFAMPIPANTCRDRAAAGPYGRAVSRRAPQKRLNVMPPPPGPKKFLGMNTTAACHS